MTEAPLAHARQEAETQRDRPEVVERHDALVVVQTIEGPVDHAVDGPAGVVDQHVDASVIAQHRVDQPLAGSLVG